MYIIFHIFLLIAAYDLYHIFHFYVSVNYWQDSRPIPVTEIDLKDALLFLQQKLNYYIHFFICLYDIFHLRFSNNNGLPNRDIEQAVIELILNTTAVTHLHLEDQHYTLKLLYSNMMDPKEDLDTLLVKIDYNLNAILEFRINNEHIKDNIERLTIITSAVTTGTHVPSHRYFDIVYRQSKSYNHRFHLHGQYLNYVAHTLPGVVYVKDSDVLARIVKTNASMLDKRHQFLLRDVHLQSKSRYLSFIVKSRNTFVEFMKKRFPQINSELLFVCTLIHSLDHYLLNECVKNFWLVSYNGKFADWRYNFGRMMYSAPCQYLFTNYLRDDLECAQLYRSLAALDQELADNVTLSITF